MEPNCKWTAFLYFFLPSFTTSDRGNVLTLSEREKDSNDIGSESITLFVGGLMLQTTCETELKLDLLDLSKLKCCFDLI